jgi:hypothetical protein
MARLKVCEYKKVINLRRNYKRATCLTADRPTREESPKNCNWQASADIRLRSLRPHFKCYESKISRVPKYRVMKSYEGGSGSKVTCMFHLLNLRRRKAILLFQLLCITDRAHSY